MDTGKVVFSIHAKSREHYVYKEVWKAFIGGALLAPFFERELFLQNKSFAMFRQLTCKIHETC